MERPDIEDVYWSDVVVNTDRTIVPLRPTRLAGTCPQCGASGLPVTIQTHPARYFGWVCSNCDLGGVIGLCPQHDGLSEKDGRTLDTIDDPPDLLT